MTDEQTHQENFDQAFDALDLGVTRVRNLRGQLRVQQDKVDRYEKAGQTKGGNYDGLVRTRDSILQQLDDSEFELSRYAENYARSQEIVDPRVPEDAEPS